jgi:hypothetical protein
MNESAEVVMMENERCSSRVPARQLVQMPASGMFGESFRKILNGRFPLSSLLPFEESTDGMMQRRCRTGFLSSRLSKTWDRFGYALFLGLSISRVGTSDLLKEV